MFVKLLALLISNVLVSFSVLLCCRSLTSICGLKGENDLKWRFGVPVSAIKRTALEPSRQDRVPYIELAEPVFEHNCARAQDL
jgi:hypothetical protein